MSFDRAESCGRTDREINGKKMNRTMIYPATVGDASCAWTRWRNLIWRSSRKSYGDSLFYGFIAPRVVRTLNALNMFGRSFSSVVKPLDRDYPRRVLSHRWTTRHVTIDQQRWRPDNTGRGGIFFFITALPSLFQSFNTETEPRSKSKKLIQRQ